MGLTVTNTNTFQLLSILNRTAKAQSNVITQLSTGLRINRGADDPAGLIALMSLRAEIGAVDAALANNQRTDAVLGVADNALGEIHNLLNEINSLVIASASDGNLSNAEIAANQAQIDLAIQSIDRIVRTTTFNGKRLIDGTGAVDTAVASSNDIGNLRIFNRGNITSDLTFAVTVSTAAATAQFALGNFSGASRLSAATEIAITGTLGTTTVELGVSATAASAVAAINLAKDVTGVSAATSGSTVVLQSTTTGSDAFLSVDILSGGGLQNANNLQEASVTSGTDASGTINGQSFAADGQDVSFNVGGVSGSFSLGSSFTTGTSNFTVKTTGGFTFQLGSQSNTRTTIGIDGLFSHKLGGGSAGAFLSELRSGQGADLSSAANRATALAAVQKSIRDVAVAQGRIGGFQKFQVQPAVSSLNAAKIGLTDAASIIGDTDFALATAELNKQSVLLNSGISLLGLANQQAAQILALIGG
ncbi:MAG: flagellin [Planctomycetota bacterium]|nr:flagellin [Planctomycetota bacterium]